MNDVEDFAEAVERSSFGTPTAKALRDQTPDDIAERIVNRAEEISEEAGSMNVDRLVEQARELLGSSRAVLFHVEVLDLLAGLADAVEQLRDGQTRWSSCATCGVPIFEHHAWSHQGGTPQVDHDAEPDHDTVEALLDGRVPSTGQETT